ncbi:hypothetical protein CJA_0649 [Cellvibrio japonicus Ueda107]|uniref:Uncharacterized protein n=1 Tax=Cellvibrio japonicus (strain Ueda107) TaxID=498211 RepID=B3PJP1_CELJU|nr:hypothetical protein CJA_0649 [Cellvibrio japonicus Ueda107]
MALTGLYTGLWEAAHLTPDLCDGAISSELGWQ